MKKKIIKFISKNKKPSSLTFHCRFNSKQPIKTYFFEHNKTYKLPINIIDHLNKAGKNNIKDRDKFELIPVNNLLQPEKENLSNLTGFFALLYQVDLRNKQNSSNKNEDQKSIY